MTDFSDGSPSGSSSPGDRRKASDDAILAEALEVSAKPRETVTRLDEPVDVARNPSLPPPEKAPVVAAIIVTATAAVIVGLSLWFLVQPQPLLVQGEADATRIDIAARVDGRIGARPVSRGEAVSAGKVLATIDNPELQMKLAEAEAARLVAIADLTRIETGTRAEVIAERKAAIAAGEAKVMLAQQTYDRTAQLMKNDVAPVQKLDEATASLDIAKRTLEQTKLAYAAAVAGYTKEERGVAKAAVDKAEAAITTLKAQVAELTISAPVSAEIYQIAAEPGEYVSPGVPLLSLVDLSDVWLRFDLREDLIEGLKIGDRFTARLPALGDVPVEVEVRTIATRGEYAGWRATRATGDFDLRTFEVRAYPVGKVAGLRPGMSAYLAWRTR